MNNEERLNYWKSVIDECDASGKPVNIWCKENRITISCLYKWRRIIYPNRTQKTESAHFVPMIMKDSEKTVSIAINNVELRFDESLLEKVIGAIR